MLLLSIDIAIKYRSIMYTKKKKLAREFIKAYMTIDDTRIAEIENNTKELLQGFIAIKT